MVNFGDPATVAGMVTMIGALAAAVVSILNAIFSALGRRKLTEKVDESNKKADAAAAHAAIAAERTVAADAKLDTIQTKADEAVNNTNGHLSRMTGEIQRTQAQNQALQETIVTLTALLASHRAASPPAPAAAPPPPPNMQIGTRATDVPLKVTIVDKDDRKSKE